MRGRQPGFKLGPEMKREYLCPKCERTFLTYPPAFATHSKFCGRRDEFFWAKVNKTEKCWLWTGFLNHDGYGRVGPIKGVRSGGRAHKIAWEMANGPVPEGLSVMHLCDTRACVRLDHLKLGTHQENMLDCLQKKRTTFGEKSHSAKLTEAQAIEIKALRGKVSQRELSEKYGVSQTAICCVQRGRSWKYL